MANRIANLKVLFATCLLLQFFIACNNGDDDSVSAQTELNTVDTSQQVTSERKSVNTDSIIDLLQGKWREPEYPYRVADFKKNTVKFVEEGVIEPPRFREFKILKECPYEINNIKNAVQDDLFLVIEHKQTCDILNVTKDSLTLSGFNAHTKENYKIVYKKEK